MRYAAPVAMPVGLGEWLGAELEARGVEAASLYARAVLSILLHSEVAEAEAELDPERDPAAWNPRAALELELRLERHTKETRRGRPSIKKNFVAKSGNPSKRSCNMATSNGKNQGGTLLRRRPHSWNGDEEALKKCAAIECLLSATDDGQWGPVEKLVDELCARLKLLQLEQAGGGADGRAKQRWNTGGSAPECIEAVPTSSSSSESDSFTSVSSPEGEQENYLQAFPPLEYLSDSDQGVQPEPIWNVRKTGERTASRVRFVRMTGTRLSPPPFLPPLLKAYSYGDSCTSEAYFGDCSRDSSLERALSPPVAPAPSTKGRLYERGGADLDGSGSGRGGGEDGLINGGVGETVLNDMLDNAFKSYCQFHEKELPIPLTQHLDQDEFVPPSAPSLPTVRDQENNPWETDWSRKPSDNSSIWAPVESDWALMGPESLVVPWPSDQFTAKVPTDAAVQLSLALLNHNPEKSGFSPVLAKSLMDRVSLPNTSKLMKWLTSLASGQHVDCDEKEVEYILKEPAEVSQHLAEDEEEEQENLLTSPKTHFCPIQQEGEVEVQVSDGATFDVDGQPEEVHFLRSPSGALYLPDCEESGDGWKGWTKYMVYRSRLSPSPVQLLETGKELEQQQTSSRPTTPFTLKFRVVQTEKCCQTDPRLSIDHDKLAVGPLSISSPFSTLFSTAGGLLGVGDVWKFDAQAVTVDLLDDEEREALDPLDGKEEELDGLLNEVWTAAAALNDGEDCDEPDQVTEEVELGEELPKVELVDSVPVVETLLVPVAPEIEETARARSEQEEFDLDELWNPFMEETGGEQVDVCEWAPQPYTSGGDGDQWAEEDALAADGSWPPPNIPVEYFDDEFFDEIYGSLDSMKASDAASGGGGGGGGGGTGKNSRRRRRRSSQKQAPTRRPRRPCSFFVEGECRRPDCKFSHDLGSITCRFWIESSCFKGDECPFLHGIATKESERDRNRSCSDAELSESYGSAEEARTPRCFRERSKAAKKFQFDLEADFPSLSQAPKSSRGVGVGGPVISQSRPIAITQGFATADQSGSSAGNGASECSGLKRRRKRFTTPRVSTVNLVGTSSESSPVEAVSINVLAGKRSRKVAKINALCASGLVVKREKACKRSADAVVQSERRRTKSEHDTGSGGIDGGGGGGSAATRSRMSSSYKEG